MVLNFHMVVQTDFPDLSFPMKTYEQRRVHYKDAGKLEEQVKSVLLGWKEAISNTALDSFKGFLILTANYDNGREAVRSIEFASETFESILEKFSIRFRILLNELHQDDDRNSQPAQ